MNKDLKEVFEHYWWEGQHPIPQRSEDIDAQKIAEIISDKDTPHEIADKCLLMFCPANVILAWRKRQFFAK